ncbi:MAG: IS66 family insertion sequence element accessory protein TnpB [Chlamydiota bacterium]
MLQITPHMRTLVCVEPIDFRKGIDGFTATCRNHLGEDPHKGSLFLFVVVQNVLLKFLYMMGKDFGFALSGSLRENFSGG